MNDTQVAQTTMKQLAALQNEKAQFLSLKQQIEDGLAVAEILDENDIRRLSKMLEKSEFAVFLNGKYDAYNAIVSLHAGQGGVEAMDWTAMLYRMYLRYCESQSWAAEVIEETRGDEAGIKSVSFWSTAVTPTVISKEKWEHTVWFANHRLMPIICAKLLLLV